MRELGAPFLLSLSFIFFFLNLIKMFFFFLIMTNSNQLNAHLKVMKFKLQFIVKFSTWNVWNEGKKKNEI